MHVILLSWEFPPTIIGQISRDCERIANGLAEHECEVDVITYNERLTRTEKRKEGFRIHRVANPVRTNVNIVTWALTLNTEFQRVAADVIREGEDEEKVVHATEWMCAPAAIELKKTLHIPYVFSLYSTESERSAGGPLSAAITYLERSGSHEAARTIVSSKSRADVVRKTYGVPEDRIAIIDAATAPIISLIEQYRISLTSVKGSSDIP